MPRRRLLVDLGPLRRSRSFRILIAGQGVSTLGSQLTAVAVPYQVFRLTHSSLAVGLVSLTQLVPLLVCSLIGGAVADAHDRRKVLLITESLFALTSAGLAVNGGLAEPSLWPLFVLTAAAGGIAGFDRPTFNAAIPRMVGQDDLVPAFALWQAQFQLGLVVGPAVAGIILASGGLATVYWLDVATFVVSLASVLALPSMPPAGGGVRTGWKSIAEGFSYVRGRQVIQGVYLLDINAMVFGMPRALFPAIGLDVFHGGARAVGFLYAAPGAGALAGALTTGWVKGVRRQGRAVIIAVILWGAAIVGFGLARELWVALALLAVAGWADVLSAVFRSTILQSRVPDTLRGRLSAIQIAVVQGGPRLGDLEAGLVAEAVGVTFSVVTGGVACVAGAGVLALLLPDFRNQVAGSMEPAQASPPGSCVATKPR